MLCLFSLPVETVRQLTRRGKLAANEADNLRLSAYRQLLARLFRYVRPHWRVFALGVVAMMLTGSTETALPARPSRVPTAAP